MLLTHAGRHIPAHYCAKPEPASPAHPTAPSEKTATDEHGAHGFSEGEMRNVGKQETGTVPEAAPLQERRGAASRGGLRRETQRVGHGGTRSAAQACRVVT